MKKVIRLTEKDLTKLIQKIVLEEKRRSLYEAEISRHGMTQDLDDTELYEEDDDFEEVDFESDYGKMTKEDAIEKIADFLSSEVLSDLSPKELSMLKNKIHGGHSQMRRMDEEEDEMNDLESRRASRVEKGMMRGGLGLSAASAVAALGEFMGYSEFDLTNMIHDINHMAGLENYTGPVTLGMVALGLAMALKGLDMRMRRTGK